MPSAKRNVGLDPEQIELEQKQANTNKLAEVAAKKGQFADAKFNAFIYAILNGGSLDEIKEMLQNNKQFVNTRDNEDPHAKDDVEVDIVAEMDDEGNIEHDLPDYHRGDYPLHYAAKANRPELIQYLYDNDAQLDSTNAWNATPLHRAVAAEAKEAVMKLLSLGASLDAQTTVGNIPLHVAAYTGNAEIVALLQAKGAETSTQQAEVRNLLEDYPRDYGKDPKVVKLLGEGKYPMMADKGAGKEKESS